MRTFTIPFIVTQDALVVEAIVVGYLFLFFWIYLGLLIGVIS